jgi:hypothetical protein
MIPRCERIETGGITMAEGSGATGILGVIIGAALVIGLGVFFFGGLGGKTVIETPAIVAK